MYEAIEAQVLDLVERYSVWCGVQWSEWFLDLLRPKIHESNPGKGRDLALLEPNIDTNDFASPQGIPSRIIGVVADSLTAKKQLRMESKRQWRETSSCSKSPSKYFALKQNG